MATPLHPRLLSFSTAIDAPMATESEPEGMRSYVRVRPCDGAMCDIDLQSEKEVTLGIMKTNVQGTASKELQTFEFDAVFDPNATQEKVFETAMRPQVDALFSGRDTLTFAYGPTGTGKTYTLQGGSNPEDRGMVLRALDDVFGRLPSMIACCTIHLSFLEVLGNHAYDLLAPEERGLFGHVNPRKKLRLKEKSGGLSVEGLKEVEISDIEAATQAYLLGCQNRRSASNGVNEESSRSHAVLTLKLCAKQPGSAPMTITRLNVVDLAGAERQRNNQGQGPRLVEAKNINKDLTILGRCLRTLRANQSASCKAPEVPPFRESNLTKLFRDFLTGRGGTVVIAAVHPRAADAEMSLRTLEFAAAAQHVKPLPMPPPPPRAKSSKRLLNQASSSSVHADSLAASERDDDSTRTSGSGDYSSEMEYVAALEKFVAQLEAEKVQLERRVRGEAFEQVNLLHAL